MVGRRLFVWSDDRIVSPFGRNQEDFLLARLSCRLVWVMNLYFQAFSARLARCVAPALALAVLGSTAACPNMGDIMRLYGYTEIRPPSKFFAPGTMVWVRSSSPFSAGIICTESASLGSDFRPVVSETAAMELKKATDRAFSIDADYLSLLRADARFSHVGSVTVRLERPVLFEVIDTDIIKHHRNRSAACRQAIAMRRKAGYQVTMIASALQADATYTIGWSHEVGGSVGSSDETLAALALELGAHNAQVHERTITAKGLFWGIKDDAYMAQMSEPHMLLSLGKHVRLLSANSVMFASEVPDVAEEDEPMVSGP